MRLGQVVFSPAAASFPGAFRPPAKAGVLALFRSYRRGLSDQIRFFGRLPHMCGFEAILASGAAGQYAPLWQLSGCHSCIRFLSMRDFWPAPITRDMAAGDGLSGEMRLPAQYTMRVMASAFTRSMKKAEISGRMMKARGAAPWRRVTAVMLAMAVGVAPRPMPVKPEEMTAA